MKVQANLENPNFWAILTYCAGLLQPRKVNEKAFMHREDINTGKTLGGTVKLPLAG